MLFAVIYTFFLLIIMITASPILILFFLFKKKYRQSIPSRFFLFKNTRQKKKNGYWFHACSLGEVNSLKPFFHNLKQRGFSLSLTTTTDSGFRAGKSFCTSSQFLPFEPFLTFWIKPQKKLIVVEAEFWFMLFFVAKIKGAETIILSGRISDRSYPRYKKFSWLYSKIFQNIDKVFVQSEIDKKRFSELGAKNIEVLGNIKLLKSTSSKDLNIPKDKLIIVGASTHRGEDLPFLEAFYQYSQTKKSRFIIVPRHKERFDEVEKLIRNFIKDKNLGFSVYSRDKYFDDITLIDTYGMLIDIYFKSDIVILGGGFLNGIGGHNPVEPASFNNKIISGKYMFNQKEILKFIENIQLVKIDEIYQALKNSELLENSKITQNIDLNKIIDKVII